MTKYKSKPVEIEAVQYTGDNFEELVLFTDKKFMELDKRVADARGHTAEVFDYLHRTWIGVNRNDWIIKGTKGEFYPCEDGVFKQKYEKVS